MRSKSWWYWWLVMAVTIGDEDDDDDGGRLLSWVGSEHDVTDSDSHMRACQQWPNPTEIKHRGTPEPWTTTSILVTFRYDDQLNYFANYFLVFMWFLKFWLRRYADTGLHCIPSLLSVPLPTLAVQDINFQTTWSLPWSDNDGIKKDQADRIRSGPICSSVLFPAPYHFTLRYPQRI